MSVSMCKLKSFEIQQGERILKVEQYGIKTADFATSFGDDSVAPKNWSAVYCDTDNSGDKIIIGYINKNQLDKIKEGEKRIFSLDESGNNAAEIYLKNDGKIEINGNVDNLVRYIKLNEALQAQKDLINTELQKIVVAFTSVGGSYAISPITLNISQSKIEELQSP